MARAADGIGVKAVVTAFYRVLLMREPDQGGLDSHVGNVTSGAATIEQTLAAFLNSPEFAVVAPRLLLAHGQADAVRFINDHSQYGEIEMLIRQWVNEGVRHRIVVDVGARGRDRSNSFDLLRVFGWRGLLIEANTRLIEAIRAEFAGLHFDLLNHAVSDHDGEAVFHIGINDDVSSLNADASQAWGAIQGRLDVSVRRLAPLLEAHDIPFDFDLLSLDIEGEDLKVLNDLIGNSAYRPVWIIIEASFEFRTKSLAELDVSALVQAQYRIVGQTYANLILRRT